MLHVFDPDLRVRLDGEGAAAPKGLDESVGSGDHRGVGRHVERVLMERQDRLCDEFGHRIGGALGRDRRRDDTGFRSVGEIRPATEGVSDELRAETDAEDGHVRRHGGADGLHLVVEVGMDGRFVGTLRPPEHDEGAEVRWGRDGITGRGSYHLRRESAGGYGVAEDAEWVTGVVLDDEDRFHGAMVPAPTTGDRVYLRRMDAEAAVRRHRTDREADFVAGFVDLLSLDNVTGDVPALTRNAAAIVDQFHRRHLEARAVARPGVAPVVVGRIPAETEPVRRLGMYAHYDGQPVDPSAWITPPFQPDIRDGRIYARGAADDKAPIAAVLAAVDALAAAGIGRTTEVVVLFEGEEESGSTNLADYMRELAGELTADLWLICDGPVHPSGRPQVVFGVRGYCGFELTVYGPERELHSGHFGNWVPNPAVDLARLLATCKDDTGHVLIEGFYDTTMPITVADREAIAALPPVEDHYRDDIGFAEAERVAKTHAGALLWPTFNVRGLRAADVGAGARNVIPTSASASVDIRLAAGNDPDDMLDLVLRHVEKQGYVVLDGPPTPAERRTHRHLATMVRDVGYPAVRVPVDQPGVDAIVAAAGAAAGSDVVRLPTFGGSVPLHQFGEILDTPMVVLPIANYDNNQHAANENLKIDNLWYGVELWARLLTSHGV